MLNYFLNAQIAPETSKLGGGEIFLICLSVLLIVAIHTFISFEYIPLNVKCGCIKIKIISLLKNSMGSTPY